MSATQSDPKPAIDQDQLFTQGKAAPGCGLRRKLRRYKRTVAGVAGSSSSTAAAVQHATGAAAHATKSNGAAGESSSGAQDTNPKCKGESYTVSLLRECLQKEEMCLKLMDNQTGFILAVVLGEICIGGRSMADIVADLEHACYDMLPVHEDGLEETFTGHSNGAQQGIKKNTISCDYLLDMPISWLSIEKLQELQEEAEFQAARVARAQAALAPELSEPEVATALAECHAEIERQTTSQHKCGAGLREGSLHTDPFCSLPEVTQEEGKAQKSKATVVPSDCEEQPLPGVQKPQDGLAAAAEFDEEKSPPGTAPPPELLVMSPCLQVLLTSTVAPKAIVHEDSLAGLMQLVAAAPVHQPPSIYTQTPESPQPCWQDDAPGPVPPAFPPLQRCPLHPPQQQSAHFHAPFRPLAPPHWPPQPSQPYMAGTAALMPWPPQPPGPFTAGTRGFVPPPRPPPYEPPRPPPFMHRHSHLTWPTISNKTAGLKREGTQQSESSL
ncbi:g11177 [Coccomyxa elongata]